MSRKIAKAFSWTVGLSLVSGLAAGSFWVRSRQSPATATIALIPQTAGAMLWEVEHTGATAAAEKLKYHLYWNAPTSESDVAGQVSLIERVSRGNYQGLILAPNHPLAMLAPIRHALTAGLPVVIVSAQLDLPPETNLGYIVNDDEKMGELAAVEIANALHGRGSIALAGIGRYAPGIKSRVLGAERLLASRYPDIAVVSRMGAAFNTTLAEEFTTATLDSNPRLGAVLSFTAPSTKGVLAALKNRGMQRTVKLVACEQDTELVGYLSSGEVTAVVAQNTYRMGYEAVGLISGVLKGKPMPALSVVPPVVITRANLSSVEAIALTSYPK
ncbi:MAG: Ribose transport system, periplasmic ribose-binding protein RbsB [Bryobacterales bacterium]|nr:Ribose transport system, periplasmic ribose-binding protein RbsB [Bryobacterales bacterium]